MSLNWGGRKRGRQTGENPGRASGDNPVRSLQASTPANVIHGDTEPSTLGGPRRGGLRRSNYFSIVRGARGRQEGLRGGEEPVLGA